MPNLYENEELILESDLKICFIRQGDKAWRISTFKAKGQYWFFVPELIRIFKIDNVMTLRRWAGKYNADLKRIKLEYDIYPKEYPLVNEEGFANLLDHVNRQNRYMFDF